ncbi:hypothetical protein Tco_0913588, partial [Tanacetum coccineum]
VKILDAIDHNLPQKEKDPGSFTLPYLINNVCFDKALVDLGASVSVMPFSTYINLGLGVLSHTRLTIGKFVFLIDFIILDIPEDDDVPLILERSFLSTTHVKIDVFKRKVTLRVLAENRIDLMVYSEKCHVLNSHGHFEALINTPFAQTLKMENLPEQTIRGVSSF